MVDPRDLIDIERYPIDDPAAPRRKALVDRCHRALDDGAICVLDGFVRPEAVASMAAEAGALSASAYRNENRRTPYGWMHNGGFPEDHPRSALFLNANAVVLTHQLSGDTSIERLYHWDVLTDFVREALGYESLYRCACPHLSLMLSAMGQGDQLGWHFDTNDGVVSLLLQSADRGGHFECAPYIRAEEDENYATVARLFAGEDGIATRPPMAAGSFVLFKGRRTCHRVTAVGETAKPRLIALFSYHQEPGMVFPLATSQDLMNPKPDPYRGQVAPG